MLENGKKQKTYLWLTPIISHSHFQQKNPLFVQKYITYIY